MGAESRGDKKELEGLVTDHIERNLYLAARNLHKVNVLDSSGLDPVSLIDFENVLITVPALKKVEEMIA